MLAAEYFFLFIIPNIGWDEDLAFQYLSGWRLQVFQALSLSGQSPAPSEDPPLKAFFYLKLHVYLCRFGFIKVGSSRKNRFCPIPVCLLLSPTNLQPLPLTRIFTSSFRLPLNVCQTFPALSVMLSGTCEYVTLFVFHLFFLRGA